MAFCINCGQELAEGAKFCANYGSAVNDGNSTNQRKTTYEGEIRKCPNCGEVLESFSARCPSCGMEFRGTKATSSVREFALKLEAIEAQREYEKPAGIFGRVAKMQQISKTDEQKISLIKNFSVPNTKEDILEFMILATSNVDMSMYGSLDTPTAGAKAMTEAWNAKIKQVYVKAKNTYKSDPDFAKIQELYDSCYADIAKQKKKKILKWVLLVGWIPLLWAIILIPLIISSPKDEAKEIERLEAIVVEVQDALERKEYKLALNNADSIDYQRYDVEMERKWDIQREYWVDKVLEEAAKEGIVLEYTPTPDIDKANDELDDSDNSGGLIDGLKDGVQSGLDSAKENIDEFNNIMNGSSSTISKETLEQFINGYDNAVFDDYNSPASENGLGDSRIYIYCTLDKTEILEADGTTSILGYVTDETDNEWLIQLHFVPAVSKTAFDTYVGKELILRGVYSGFSGTKKMPVVVLDEMIVLATGENVVGMQKLLDE